MKTRHGQEHTTQNISSKGLSLIPSSACISIYRFAGEGARATLVKYSYYKYDRLNRVNTQAFQKYIWNGMRRLGESGGFRGLDKNLTQEDFFRLSLAGMSW